MEMFFVFLLRLVGLTFFVTLGVLRHRCGSILFQVEEGGLILSDSHAPHGNGAPDAPH